MGNNIIVCTRHVHARIDRVSYKQQNHLSIPKVSSQIIFVQDDTIANRGLDELRVPESLGLGSRTGKLIQVMPLTFENDQL